MGSNYIFANTGQLVRFVVQTVNGSGQLVDGYVPIVQSVVFPDLSLAAGYPRAMTRISTGLYAHGLQLPTGADALGSYIATVQWEEDGYGPSASSASSVHIPLQITSDGQDTFDLPSEPLGSVVVFIDGVKQEIGDYTVSGTQLQWTGQELLVGDLIEILYNFDVSSGLVPVTLQKNEVFVINVARPFGVSAASPI